MNHYLAELSGDFSNNTEILNMMLGTCHSNNLSVLKYTSHDFYPMGFTAVILLAESHLAVHSWPEDSKLLVDLFLCGETEIAPKLILKDLAERLNAEVVNITKQKR